MSYLIKRKFLLILILVLTFFAIFAFMQTSLAQSRKPTTNQQNQPSALASLQPDHVAIRVPNFEETVQWYEEKLGFRELVRLQAPPYVDSDLRFAYLERNGSVIEIAGGGKPTRTVAPPVTIQDTFRAQGYIHVCLRVNDIDAATAELKQRGVEVFAGPNTNPTLNRKFIHFRDNNGFDVELVQYLS